MTTETYEAMQARLTKAFNLVADPADWRGPINAFVRDAAIEGTGIDLAAIREAVIHFTGTVPAIAREARPNMAPGYTVRAVGYRAGPCGP